MRLLAYFGTIFHGLHYFLSARLVVDGSPPPVENHQDVSAVDNKLNVTFFDLLTILFIYLRLTGIIDWSWLVVLAPELVPLGLYVLLKAFASE